jgi:coenzyme F420-dependent glucose-6-phosphate dehydrogenase
VKIGYHLSSEELPAPALVRNAAAAEEAGFDFATISDHFHPWTDRQGQSPFVWGVLGAIAQTTERMTVGTAVTCPTIRVHPTLVAQAAATAAQLMPGRFWLGVGTGENLNEHIVGRRWPSVRERRDMLEEAIDVIRQLWSGQMTTHVGPHVHVHDARIYSMPEEPPPIMVGATGTKSAELAGRLGDGLIGTAPIEETVRAFERAGGAGKPRFGMVHVCWAHDEPAALRIARELWPNAAIPGELGQELPLPRHFEQAAKQVTEEQVAETVVCGPDAGRHVQRIREYLDAGYDRVFVHQVGVEQAGFLRLYADEVIPELRSALASA